MTGQSFLIVRFSAIGDCVMAAYTATAIRNALQNTRIVWAVDTRCRPVIADTGLTDEVVDFPRDDWRRQRWSPMVWKQQLGRFARLRKLGLDVGLDLQGHTKTALCLKLAAPKHRLSAFSTDPVSARLNPQLSGDPNSKHRIERMLDAANQFGTFEMPAQPTMPARTECSDPKLITISTGAGAANKIYPAEKWKVVAQHYLEQGYRVEFLGAGSDPRIAVPGTRDSVGKLNLRNSMQKVASSALHLAADTGSGHIAAAYGVPVVSIFGPTNPFLFRPYTQFGVVLQCGPKPEDCSPEEVISAGERLLAAHG